ncbi:MAG: hypothetical protein F6K17_16165 [Okeania sp. SIO3C4]|nr:hypothetical protein [Okeania sp. SIO3B3]NER04038.1 hypothetical protein [Okeania sp. SIO3C4]
MTEPFLAALAVVLVLGVVALAVVATFWKQILKWAEDSLFRWIKTNIPWIESEVREAFSALDNFIVTTRNLIRKAWEKLREYLLKQVTTFERQLSGEWEKEVTSWIIKVLESGEKVPVKIVVKEVVPWDELPPDVRAEWLKREKSEVEIDVTEYRDREIMEMFA